MADFDFDANATGSGPDGGAGPSEGSGGPGAGGVGSPPSSGGNAPGGAGGGPAPDPAIPPKRRRGRPPGSANRPKSDAGTAAPAADKGDKEGVALGFKKNDRNKVQQNIAGMHMMAAVLTKQPIVMLTEPEAKALTGAVCDVADYHKISLDGAGGPLALYLALATTAYGIYVPRIVALKNLREGETIVGVAPATPGEAKAAAQNRAGTMDFSGDIASTVN